MEETTNKHNGAFKNVYYSEWVRMRLKFADARRRSAESMILALQEITNKQTGG